MKLLKASENIQDEIKMYDPYWKRLESMDEEEEIIYMLGQICMEKWDVTIKLA